MVTMGFVVACSTGTLHDRTASPPRCTVHAPPGAIDLQQVVGHVAPAGAATGGGSKLPPPPTVVPAGPFRPARGVRLSRPQAFRSGLRSHSTLTICQRPSALTSWR